MIARSPGNVQRSTWRQALAEAISDPGELLQILELPESLLDGATRAIHQFPLRVPRDYVALIKKGDPEDPLLRQILPLEQELAETPGFSADPVGDLEASMAPGILEKYHGRSLLLTSSICATHCRYCFRRHFPFQEQNNFKQLLRQGMAHLREHPSEEVILSGGDPLSLSNKRLKQLLGELTTLPGLKRIRFHSRYPVVLPQRVDRDFLRLADLCSGRPIMVVHCNHPREISGAVAAALRALGHVGWVLYNQSVLLKGVNDRAETLAELSEKLFESGVQPYYLHLLDPVLGAAHFAVEPNAAHRLQQQLRDRLPGYLTPRMVREIKGNSSKTPV